MEPQRSAKWCQGFREMKTHNGERVLLAKLPIYRVYLSGETIRLSISLKVAVHFLRVMYIKDKQMLVFNFIFDLLWKDGGSSVSSVAFFGFCELKYIVKHSPQLLLTY